MYKEEAFETEDKRWRENELGHGDMQKKKMSVCYPPLTSPPQCSVLLETPYKPIELDTETWYF